MFIIVWNQLIFHLLDVLPKGSTFTGEHYRDNILADLLPLRLAQNERKLCFHADGARVYIAQKCRDFCYENDLRTLIHSPFSLDLMPSDFFLFEQVK
jgi:hypothetical protein